MKKLIIILICIAISYSIKGQTYTISFMQQLKPTFFSEYFFFNTFKIEITESYVSMAGGFKHEIIKREDKLIYCKNNVKFEVDNRSIMFYNLPVIWVLYIKA